MIQALLIALTLATPEVSSYAVSIDRCGRRTATGKCAKMKTITVRVCDGEKCSTVTAPIPAGRTASEATALDVWRAGRKTAY